MRRYLKNQAVQGMSLKKQCSELSIELNELQATYSGRPEYAALDYFQENGFIGTPDEGYTFKTILKALILDELSAVNTFDDRSDACVRYLEAQLEMHKDKLDHFVRSSSKTKKRRVISNLNEIGGQDYIRSYHSFSVKIAIAIFKSVGRESLTNLLAKFSEDPYSYRSGWPDLTIVREREVQLVEIKTTDKLHSSQLVTMPMLQEILPCKVSVLRIKNASKNT